MSLPKMDPEANESKDMKMNSTPRLLTGFCAFFLLALSLAGVAEQPAASGKPLVFHARRQVPIKDGETEFKPVEETLAWDPRQTAVVICDMWDRHWCKGATARVAELAPRMNEVVANLRGRGVLIIHAPSATMKKYEGTPQRKLAQAAPKAAPLQVTPPWDALGLAKEPKLPVDASDDGCDCETKCPTGSPWRAEIAALEIKDGDAITDSAEALNLMRQRGITNVILMGVHTNMCVLARPFAIRAMVKAGQNVVLMRDMTDTMYNHRMPPFVSHFRGTDLVVGHIEKYWCPSVTSADITGHPPFHFKADDGK